MQNSSGGARMSPDELKKYLKSMHADQAKPTATTQRNKTQSSASDASMSFQHTATTSATEWKEKGNIQFKSGNYTAALDCYSSSIAAEPNSVGYANRAMAHLKLNNYTTAVKDCTAALDLDENYVKAWLRRGSAQRELGLLDEAIADFEAALRLEPGNKSAMEDRKSCIEKWIENSSSSSKTMKDIFFKRSTLVPITTEEINQATSVNEGLLKQVSTKRVSNAVQKERAVVIEEVKEDQPPPLPLPSQKTTKKGVSTIKSITREEDPSRGVPNAPLEKIKSTAGLHVKPEFKAPKTGVDFDRSWRGLKGSLEQQAVYLRKINADDIPKLLKQVLTPGLLVALQLTILGPVLSGGGGGGEDSSNKATAAALLEALPKVARFSMNVLSLSASQKKELSAAWDKACLEFPELTNLRSNYYMSV
jgi:tetratricopeptide (TPR) repeat protein